MTTTASFNGLRWASDRYSDGTWRAYAWWKTVEETPDIVAECDADTEALAFDGLRAAICRNYKRPNTTVENEVGSKLVKA